MLRNYPTLLITALAVSALPCSGQIDKLRGFYESLLSLPAGAKAPDPGAVSAMASQEMSKVSVDELKTIVPLVQKCLMSENPGVRADANMLLFVLVTRFDSARAIEPYEDFLIPLLSQGDRKAAIHLLGGVYPRPSAKSLSALYAHLNDEGNNAEEFEMIAASLLGAFSTDPTIIHAVLARAARYPNDNVDDSVIQSIGLAKITNDEALAYVRAGFRSPPERITVVQAIARMPKSIRDRFTSELRAVAQDPDERPETRTAAEQVLTQP